MHKNDVHGSLMCWPVRFAHLQVQICFTFFNSGFRPYGISTTKKTQVVSSYPSRRPASPAAPFLSPISPPTAAAPFFYAAPTQVDATRSLPPACHRAHSRRSGLPALCARRRRRRTQATLTDTRVSPLRRRAHPCPHAAAPPGGCHR